jgi:hypothetical protein
MTVPIPSNLGLLLPFLDTEAKKQDVRPLFEGETDVLKNILTLSKHWRLRIKFDTPVRVQLNRRRSQEVTEHVFHGFFWSKTHNRLCYANRRPHRIGYTFHWLHNVVSYEPVLDTKTKDKFTGYDQFQAKFDRRYITDAEIQTLWNMGSTHHSGQYRPSDFKPFTKIGKDLMKRFDAEYTGIGQPPSTPDSGYEAKAGGSKYYLSKRYYSWDDSRGDSTISYETTMEYVLYSLCHGKNQKRGKYGLIATKNTYLQLGIG